MKSTFRALRLTPLARSRALACALSSTLVPALAATDGPGISASEDLRPIVVTGTVVPRTLGSEIAATTVLDRAELERAGVRDLVGALQRLGTVLADQQGGPGTLATVRLRGADSRDTLVLVDGVPLNDVTSGMATLQHLPVALIERIEVVRGNLSALYGGNATGGVIQVFTRRGSAATDARVSVHGGSRATAGADASVGFGGTVGGRAWRARLAAGGERSDGFSAIDSARVPTANPDDDGHRRNHAALAADVDLAAGHGVGLDLRRVDGRADYDSAWGAPGDTHGNEATQGHAALRGRHALTDGWRLDWRAGYGRERRSDTSVSAFGAMRFASSLRQRSLALDAHGSVGDWTLQLGAERVAQATDSPSYVRRERRTDTARLGASRDAAWGGVQVNLRHDRSDDFGSATTGLLGGRWRLTPRTSVVGSLSTSFTAPTFDLLYYDCAPFGFVCSNPDLKPERGRNADLGLQWDDGATLLRATLFAARHRDKFHVPGTGVPVNASRAENAGVELAVRHRSGPWSLAGEATLHDPRETVAGTERRALRRPREQAALRLEHDGGAWDAGMALRHVGARRDMDGATPRTLESATLVDVHARWAFAANWSLQANVENLFDRESSPAWGYRGRPRGVFVGLAWHTPQP